jgi:acyl-CoA dehydrogenase
MGWRCSDTAELSLTDVRVPAAHVLGFEQGFASLARHFVTERLTLAITGYATGQRCLDLALAWTKERETFGRPLATRQVVRHTLAEMHRQVDVARVYCHNVAACHAAGEDVLLDALLAKQTGVAAGEFVADRAVQLFGGAGYMTGTEVERHYRDVRILGIGGGATEVMTDLATRLLGI